MSESYGSKPIVILKTSFSVSFISAAGLGIYYSWNNDHSFNEFLYVTYVFFVNNLLMPVSIAAIVCYYISRDNTHSKGLVGKLRSIGILSIVSLVLLFVWNVMDLLFHYHLDKELSTQHFQDGLLLGAMLAIPIAVLVSLIYDYMDAR